MSVPAVPLYDSLGESSVEYIIDHAEASTVFTSTQKFPLLEKTLPKTKQHIKTIVYFGDVTEDSKRVSAKAEEEASAFSRPWLKERQAVVPQNTKSRRAH